MSSSRSLKSIVPIFIFILVMLIVTIVPSQAAVMRRARWWGGGENIAYHFDYTCTDSVEFNFLVHIDEVPSPDTVDVKITVERDPTNELTYTLPIEEVNFEIEVYGVGILEITHQAYKIFDLTPLNLQKGDRIAIVTSGYGEYGSNDLTSTVDCVKRGPDGTGSFMHDLYEQGITPVDFESEPAIPVFPQVNPLCTVGTTTQQFQITVEEDKPIGTFDIAMHFEAYTHLDGLHAELSHTHNNATTTVLLWDDFVSGQEPVPLDNRRLGSRCQTSLQYDPMADFLLTDNSSYPLPTNQEPPTWDRAYQPIGSLSAFTGQSTQGTWTLNICEVPPESTTIPNGDFESGSSNWLEYSSNGYPLIYNENNLPLTPHNGDWAAWLGGASNEHSQLSQSVTVPTEAPFLSYWHTLTSEDACGYDYARVYVNGNQQSEIDMCNTTGGWQQRTLNLSNYAGSQVNLLFEVETDSSISSSQFLDDITWQNIRTAAPGSSPDLAINLNTEPQKSVNDAMTRLQTNEDPLGGGGAGGTLQCWYLSFSDNVASSQVEFDDSNYTVAENGTATINAKLSFPHSKSVQVDYATYDVTAVANSDYTPSAGTLTFNPGETEKTFTIPILADTIYEQDEEVGLTLTNSVNAALGDTNSAILTIVDDETIPTVQFSSANFVVNEDDVSAQVEVSLSGESSQPTTVSFATSDGTAVAGEDYTAVASTTLTFTPGQTSKTINITILPDTEDETSETVNLTLSNVIGGEIGSPSIATLTIFDENINYAIFLPMLMHQQ